MADIAEIQQLLYRYAWAKDEQDPELLRSCFSQRGPLAGMPDALMATWPGLAFKRRHHYANIMIVEDGEDEAVVQSYMALYIVKDEKVSLLTSCWYRDRVVREDGAWKLYEQRVHPDAPYAPGDVDRSAVATLESLTMDPAGDRG